MVKGNNGEVTSMEGQEPRRRVVKVRNGLFTRYSAAILIGVLFVSAVVATGVLFHYYSFDTPTTDEPVNDVQVAKHEIDRRVLAPKEFLLPTNLKPIHYLVRLQPFIKGNFSINGYTEITFECVAATSSVILHILDIITINDTITLIPADDPATSLPFTGHSYDPVTQFYTGSLQDPLEEGRTYTLLMNFVGYLNDILVGFYRSAYLDADGNTVIIGTTQFEATDARRAFPCFDEPALKATFSIEMAREDGMLTLSNMPRISNNSIPGQPGWFLDVFEETVPMSTYLVAFVVSDFISVSSNASDHVLFRVWARQEALYQTEYAISIGPDVLTFFEGYFNIPFPLPKQDMVALPDFDTGAMENWGLITYRETALLYDPVLSGAYNKERVGVMVTHELAHQWFGDLVSPSWWSYIWLNEGFASYMEIIGYNASVIILSKFYLPMDALSNIKFSSLAPFPCLSVTQRDLLNFNLDGKISTLLLNVKEVEPAFGMFDQFLIDNTQNVFPTDSLESSHPIFFEVNDPDEINQMFDIITYSKGAAIIRMMNYFLTDVTFKQGLTNYLTTFSYSTATQDDLWASLTEQAHVDGTLDNSVTVNQIMDTWTLQMGYPVVTVVRSGANGDVLVTQERFLFVKNENSTDTHDYKWWIPLTWVTKDNPDFSQTTVMNWMSDTEAQKVVPDVAPVGSWYIFNVIENGYFRVNYDTDNWNALITQLQADYTLINLNNRAQIIDDALDIARAGLLAYDIALEVNSYLSQEVEYVPWKAATVNLEYLEQMFTWTSGYGAFKKYYLSLLVPFYDSIGFDDSLSDPHLDQLKRATAVSWNCKLDYAPCVDNAVSLYAQWMANPDDNSVISPNLKSSVFCTAIAEGNADEWNFAWNQYLTSNLGTDKDYLLDAMGCSRQIWILARYLDLGFTDGSGVRRQDSYRVFNSVARNDYGRDLVWDYLRNQWYIIADYYGSFTSLSGYVYTVTYEFNTQMQLNELLVFNQMHREELGSATQSVDQAIENVRNNINWMDNYYQEIDQWLIDNGYSDPITTRKAKHLKQ